MDIIQRLDAIRAMLDRTIPGFLPESAGPAHRLLEAMRYSTSGGKRIRGFITIQAAAAFGMEADHVLPAAVAMELMHAASLIHDDMPCIDDSPTRRGVPSCHVQFDEHTALLAGDALIIKAFELLAQMKDSPARPEAVVRVIGEFAQATGATGLIGGEAADIEGERQPVNEEMLSFIHINKTAKLIVAAARTGAILAGADEDALGILTEYAHHLGLLFQITDDILDATATEAQLGKPVGADEAAQKMTYPALMGVGGARRRADEIGQMAVAAAEKLPDGSDVWIPLVHLVIARQS